MKTMTGKAAALALTLCLAAEGGMMLAGCTPAELGKANRICAGVQAGVTSAEEIAARLAAAGVAPAKIPALVSDLELGRAVLTDWCAVIAAIPARTAVPATKRAG